MKKKIAWYILFLLGAANLQAEQMDWFTNFREAKAAAAERNVPVLADFAGSDWCGWCMKLDREVFSKPEFKAYAKDHLVLFLADFPSGKPQTEAVKQQNKMLSAHYKVEGFPTVLLLDSTGKVIGRTGYRAGGPAAYVEHIKQLGR